MLQAKPGSECVSLFPISQRVKLLVISTLSHRHSAAVTPDIVAPALLEYT